MQEPDSRSAQPTAAPQTTSILLVVVGLMLAMFLSSLSQTVLSAAMPTMVGELGGVDLMLWIVTAFMLASTVSMPVYGKLGDLIGRRGLLITAIVIFMIGSAIAALAGDMLTLIAGRVVQGLGGGGLMILSQAIIADIVPARDRGKYMGAMGGVFAVSSVAGPLLGGWFTEGPGWRWSFWISLPLGALALIAAIFLLRLPRYSNERPRFDVWGLTLMVIATTSIVLVSSWGGGQYAWNSPVILGLIGLGVVSAVAFVLVERVVAEPIIPLHLFRRRNFNLTTIAGLLTMLTMIGTLSYLPTYLQMTQGSSATESGLLMIPMMAMMLLTSTLTGWLVSRTGRYKIYPIVGSVVLAVGLGLLGTITPDTPLWLFCSYLAIVGLGLGTTMQLLVLIVQNTFPLREVGTATASNNFFRQIGGSLGAAVLGSLFTARLMTELTGRLDGQDISGGGLNSLTPEMVHQLPDAVRGEVIVAYNDALAPLFLYFAPLALVAAVLLCFVRETALSTTLDRDVVSEALAEGQILIPTGSIPTIDTTTGGSDAVPARRRPPVTKGTSRDRTRR